MKPNSKTIKSIQAVAFLAVTLLTPATWAQNTLLVGPSETYVTIQSAIDASAPGDTIQVASGTYEEQLYIDKPLSLLGPNATVPGMGTRVAEAIVQFPAGSLNDAVLIYTDQSNVTIAGFDIRSQDTFAAAGIYNYLLYTAGANNLTIRNNRMYSSEIPIYLFSANFGANGSGLLVEGNYVDGGPQVNSSYNRGIYVAGIAGTIQDNQFVNCNIGIQYMPYGNPLPGLIQRNQVTASLIGLYNNYQTLGAAAVTWRENEVSVAPNDRTGLRATVDGAWSTTQTPFIFRGMQVITHGTQGLGNAPQATFENNKVDAIGLSAFYTGSEGFRRPAPGTGAVTLTNNSISNFATPVANASVINVVATSNWWGTTDLLSIQATSVGPVTLAPILTCGTDDSPAIGFQPFFGTTSVTVIGATSYIYNGNPQGPTNADITGSFGATTFSYEGTGATTYGPSATLPTAVGTYTATATVAGEDCYAGATSPPFAFAIIPIPTYTISGFFRPVDMAPFVNVAKAGQTIPLKFRVLDENGAPYLGLVLADIAVTSYLTSVGSGAGDAFEQFASGSGLQNFGNGNYQFNWKTPKTYANQNREVRLTVTKTGISFGAPTTALFKFTK